jgi:hypothetical protein
MQSNSTIFWVVTLFSSVNYTNISEGSIASVFRVSKTSKKSVEADGTLSSACRLQKTVIIVLTSLRPQIKHVHSYQLSLRTDYDECQRKICDINN